jgi:hypothetical protein
MLCNITDALFFFPSLLLLSYFSGYEFQNYIE